jgi:hypothetical protein
MPSATANWLDGRSFCKVLIQRRGKSLIESAYWRHGVGDVFQTEVTMTGQWLWAGAIATAVVLLPASGSVRKWTNKQVPGLPAGKRLTDPTNTFAEVPDIDSPCVSWEDTYEVYCSSDPHFPSVRAAGERITDMAALDDLTQRGHQPRGDTQKSSIDVLWPATALKSPGWPEGKKEINTGGRAVIETCL